MDQMRHGLWIDSRILLEYFRGISEDLGMVLEKELSHGLDDLLHELLVVDFLFREGLG